MGDKVVVRDASAADLGPFTEVRYTRAVHAERVRCADGSAQRYLAVEEDGVVVGFGLLTLSQPATGPRYKHLPQMCDLYIRPDWRGRGLGTALIEEMERIARRAGCREMIVGVDPENNPRAMALYRRLGYDPIDPEPVEDRWEYFDDEGNRHERVEWIVHMRKAMAEE